MSLSERIFYRGTLLPLNVFFSNRVGNVSISVQSASFDISIHPYLKGKITDEGLEKCIKQWLESEAKRVIPAKVKEWAEKTSLFPYKVRVKDQRSRWGSCSSKRNINLNWRLIMAPETVMGYVIVHELCHLQVPNHSKSFWALVAHFLPDFQVSKNWLKKYGQMLFLT
ncbi:MAG TPA: M48 family metallopeptidase [Thermotogota bacterium]|nr:M48 family metallopeptidase [Thermotogota bacterium]NLZ14673.1 M48 family metallopeptidase [Thermotogaceae bacterium]MDD8040325.1 M48 family metallopeptidase [Thermotogota bacterium]MDD8053565.1 M48 family metallopeptidase [Thermotogota bacterium]HNR62782.1 M48 family metallopeptidase [Thermotogota bacterium]